MKAISIILVLFLCTWAYGQKVSHIKMQSTTKPIIKTEINGKTAYFLIDTGSSMTIINSSKLEKYDLETLKFTSRRKAVGFNGNREWMLKVTNAEMRLDGQFSYDDFYSMNLDLIAQSILKETNIKITGIIGTDLLRKHHCIINYNQRRLTIADRKSFKKFVTLSYE